MIILFACIFWTSFIFYNSLLPAPASSEVSGRFVTLANKILLYFKIHVDSSLLSCFIRKGAHFFEFFVAALLMLLLLNKKEVYIRYTLTFVYGATVAVLDETIQIFSAGRQFAVTDIIIDISGVLFAMLLVFLIEKYLYKKETSLNKR